MTNTEIAVRAVACLIGLVAASLTGFGAWEAQYAQEGGVNYLTLAAPFVVAAAAVIPPIAERLWADHKAKSVFLWLTLVPVAVLAFYAATERVHGIKATGLAERAALATAATLAHDSLSAARASLEKVESDAAEALKLRACKEECRKKWEGEANAARQRVEEAISAVTAAEARAIPEASYKAPLWLLPLCLDLLTFGGLWVGLAPRRSQEAAEKAPAARRKPQRKPKAAPTPPAPARKRVILTGTNDNVYSFPPAV